MRGKLLTQIVFIVASLFAFVANGTFFAQTAVITNTSFTTIPAASSGTINVCAGSTILFTNTTASNSNNNVTLQSPVLYNWVFGNGQTRTTNGPHAITYNNPGTYTVTLNMTNGGVSIPANGGNIGTVTVVVSAPPTSIPSLVPTNACTNDTVVNGTLVFQTSSGTNSCICSSSTQGPAIGFTNTANLGGTATIDVYWGGVGVPANGGTNVFTTIPSTTLSGNSGTLSSFPGQLSNPSSGHYAGSGAAGTGSYNLIYVVNYGSGCIYSGYAIMSWGAGIIDFAANTSVTACNPFDYELTFDNQYPGNTYLIDWGDGTPNSVISYPNLPTLPNYVGHGYDPSCAANGLALPYTITVSAYNSCLNDTIVNTQGPFYVSTAPTASFTQTPGLTICQGQSITFDNTSSSGFSILSGGNCSAASAFQWQVNQSSNTSGVGYLVNGSMGNINATTPLSGSGQIVVNFTQPGSYTVSLEIANNDCGSDIEIKTVTVNPYPVVPSLTATPICTGGTFVVNPVNNPPNVIVPNGTTYSWTPVTNGNIGGEVSGSGSSITGTLTNTTTTVQNQVYTVQATAGGCASPNTFQVTVPVYPNVAINDASITVCNGTPFTFTPSTIGNSIPSGTTYTWTFTNNPNVTGEQNGTGSSSVISGTLNTTVYNATQSVVYTVTANAGATCPNDQFNLTVNLNAVDPGLIGNDQVYCVGNNPAALLFTSNPAAPGTLTYQWQSSSSANGTFVDIVGATSSSFDPGASIGATTYYRVIVTSTLNSLGCSSVSNVVQYLVNPNPAANAGSNFTKNCISNQNGGTIGMSPVAGINYSWSPTNDLTPANSSNPFANPSATTTYVLTATNPATGCFSISSVTVTVNLTYPTANAGPDKNKTCTQNNTGASIGTAAVANTSYSWSPNTNLTSTNSAIVTSNPGTTTTYTLIATNTASGCTSQDQVTVFVDLSIPTVNAGTDFTKTCTQNPNGMAIGMTPVSGVTYAWSPTTGLNDPNIANPIANPTSTQNYTLTATQTSSGCTLSDQVLVTVNLTVPTAIAGSPFLKTCTQNPNGANIGFAGQTGATYAWSPTTGLANSTASLTNANPSVTTTYTLTATNTASGCTFASTVLVTVDTEVPSVDAGSDFNKTCTVNPNGLQIGMTAVTGVTYVWSPTTGLSPAASSNPIANPTSNQTYTLTATDNSSGCVATDQVVVSVNITPPVAEAGNNFTIDCNQNSTGAGIGMSAVNGVTYSWSPTTGLTNGSISNPNAAPASTQTYTLTATNSLNGCVATDNVTVTVNTTAPTANAGTGFTKNCTSNTSGSQIGMATASGVNYSWSPSAGLNSSTVSNPTANPSVTTTYTLTATNQSNGCSSTSTTVVTVDTQAPLANAGPDVEISCNQNNTGVNIGMNAVNGINYVWSPATGLSATNVASPLATPTVTTPYTLIATNPTNGCSNTDFVTVTVNTALPVANAGADLTIQCNLNPAGNTLGAAPLTGHSYVWSPALGLSDPNIANPSAFPPTTTTYTVTVTNNATGCSNTDQVVVTVNNTPPSAQVSGPAQITCSSFQNGVSIGAANVNGLSYSWSPAAGLNGTTISNPTANPASTTTYTLTTTNIANGCSSTAQVLVTVNNTPPVANAGQDQNITCLTNIGGASIGMSAANGISYSWVPTTSLTPSNAATTTANPTATTTYTLTAFNPANGCSATDEVIVNVNNTPPVVNAGVDATISCTQNATGAQIGMSAEPYVNYQWSPSTGLSNNAISNPVANPSANQQYTLTATNTISGCSDQDVINVTVNNTYPTALPSTGFTKTCAQFASGSAIGGQAQAMISYSWLPIMGLSSATVSNPIANPLVTTTYTVNALNPNNGCITTTNVLVVVDTQAPTANAGPDQLISCTSNSAAPGAPIGMTSAAGINYSWSPATNLTATNISNPSANPASTQTYTLTAQDPTNGCSSTDEVIVTVNFITPIANAGPDGEITCVTNPSGFQIGTAAVAGLSYSWSPATGLSASNIAQPLANPSITTTYTLTVTNISSGCTHTDPVVVTVNNTDPVANAGTGFIKTCVNNLSPIQVGMTAVSGIQYIWSPSTALNDATASNPTIDASVSNTYTLTAYNPTNGCDATDTIQVVVNQVLPIPDAGNDFTKTCVQNPNGLVIGTTNLANHTYTWSPSTGLTNTNTYNPTANPTTTTTYTLTLTNNQNGCQATDQIVVTVDKEIPAASAGPPLLRSCTTNTNGAQIGMTPIAGVNYSWTPTAGLSAANIANPMAVPTTTTTYVLTATDQSSGCTQTAQMVFTYNFTVPAVEAGNNFTKTCALNSNPNGAVIGFSAVPGMTYAWTPTNGLTNSTAASTLANPIVTTTYTLTATNPTSGCTATDNVTVTVDIDIPVANAGTPFTKTCNTNTAGQQIGMSPVAGVNYSWTPTTGLSASNIANPTANPAVTTTYTLTATDATSQCTQTSTVTVTVLTALPTIEAGPNATITCNNQNTPLVIGTTGIAGLTYAWSPNTGLNDYTIAQPTATPSSSTTYVLTVTNPQTGCVATDNVLVTVNTTAPPINVGTPFTKTCVQFTNGTTIGSPSISGLTYAWTPATGLSSPSIGQPLANPTATTTYNLVVTNSTNGCTSSGQITVTVNQVLPTADAGNGGSITCLQTQPIQLGTTTVAGYGYAWTPPTGLSANNIANPTANPNSTQNYTLTVTDTNNGCTATDQVQVNVSNTAPAVDALIVGNQQTICAGTAITLYGAGANTYTWSNGVTNNQSFVPTSTTTYTVTGTNTTNGCQATDIITITVNPIPTVNPISSIVRCSGTTTGNINFTGSVPNTVFNWTSSNTAVTTAASGVGNIQSFTVSNTTPTPIVSTITVTPKFTLNGVECFGTPQTFTITVNPIPTVDAVNSFPICDGTATSAINFSSAFGVANTVYTWANSNTAIGLGLGSTGNIPSFVATNAGTSPIAGTITVIPSANNCSGTPITFVITVNPIPAVNVVTSQVVCNNSSTTAINFSGAVAGTVYSWSNSNTAINLGSQGSTNIPAFTATNTTNAPITGNFVVTPSYTNATGTCPGSTTTFSITVNPTPTVNTIQSQSVCVGSSTTAVSFASAFNVAGTIYDWTNSNTNIGLAASGTGDISAFVGTNTTNAPITGLITVTPKITIGGQTCNGTSQTFNITVNPMPTVVDPQDIVVCHNVTAGGVIFTGAVANTNYNWVNNTTSINLGASNTGNISAFVATNPTNAPVTATITVTPVFGTGNGACTGTSQTFTITVNPLPTVNPVANQSICVGQLSSAINFASNFNVVGTQFNWTNTNTTIGVGASGNGNIAAFNTINSSNTVQTGNFSVTPKYTNLLHECSGNPVTFSISVIPTPTVVDPANLVVCNNAAVPAVNFSGALTGTTYTWTNTATSINLAANSTGNIASFNVTNTTAVPAVAVVQVTPSYTHGPTTCTGTNESFTITVNPTPTVDAQAPSAYCVGSPSNPVLFSSSFGVAGTSFAWTNSNAAIGLAATGNGNIASFTTTNATNQSISGNIVVTPSANGCSGNSSNFNLTVNPIPTVNAVANQVKCNGTLSNAISFSGAVPGTIYNWTNNNTSINLGASGSGNIPTFTLTNTSNTPITATITVTPTYNFAGTICTGATTSFTITVNPTPTVNQVANQAICVGSSSSIIAFASTFGVNGTSYNWVNNNTSTGILASGSGAFPSFNATNTTTGVITSTIVVTPSMTNANESCSGTPMSFTYAVNPIPVMANPLDQIWCHGNQTNVVTFSSNVTGTTYNWTASNTGIGILGSGQGNIGIFGVVNTTAAVQNSTVTVTPSFTNGSATCTGTPQNMVFTINPIPSV
ncbi:MAG: beta strand repeat-containing protein, partial [Flavobacteriales bacterium]